MPREPNPRGEEIALNRLQLSSFRISPTTIKVGESVRIEWEVQGAPADGAIRFDINGKLLPPKGEIVLQPMTSSTYDLTAAIGESSRTLAQGAVSVDTSGATRVRLPEDIVAIALRRGIDAKLRTQSKIYLRRNTDVQLEDRGIAIAIRLKIDVPYFVDPDVDVDVVLRLHVTPEGEIVAAYRKFRVDVDWPWWVAVPTAPVAKLVEEVLDEEVSRGLRPVLARSIADAVNAKLAEMPRLRLCGVTTMTDAIELLLIRR